MSELVWVIQERCILPVFDDILWMETLDKKLSCHKIIVLNKLIFFLKSTLKALSAKKVTYFWIISPRILDMIKYLTLLNIKVR